MNARAGAARGVKSLALVNSLLLIFCLIVTSKIWDGAAPIKRYECHNHSFAQWFLMTRGVPYKLEHYSI